MTSLCQTRRVCSSWVRWVGGGGERRRECEAGWELKETGKRVGGKWENCAFISLVCPVEEIAGSSLKNLASHLFLQIFSPRDKVVFWVPQVYSEIGSQWYCINILFFLFCFCSFFSGRHLDTKKQLVKLIKIIITIFYTLLSSAVNFYLKNHRCWICDQ